MSVILNDDQAAVRDGAQRFAEANFTPARRRSLRDTDDGCDREALTRAAQDGWLSLLVSADHGGAEQGLQEACLVVEAFGRALAPFNASVCIATQDALAAIGAGEVLQSAMAGQIVVALSAPMSPDGVTLSAQGDGYVLNGERRQALDAGCADMFLLACKLDGKAALAIVDRNADGVAVSARRTADGGSLGALAFGGVRLARSQVLTGERAAAVLQRLRSALSILVAAELLGLMDAVLWQTVEHLKTRQQFGRALGSFQSLQFRMADVYAAVALTRALTYEAARLADGGAASAGHTASVALAKACEAAILATRTYVQMLGAMGFTDEHDAGLYLKRALVLTSAFGTALEHRHAIASVSLAEHAKEIRFREDSAQDKAFRAEVREWLDANLPKRLRHLPTRPSFEDAGFWHRKLFERGWVAPNWPKQYGGMEGSVAEQIILLEELGRIGAPEISGQAINHLGPILQVFGTPEQKAQHLPGMLTGEKIWCQGYSEPSSGSDLASLRTRGVVEGDHIVINGSKIWTTWAHYADWMFCLVRTNPDVKKQEGLTFVLIDMKTPGVKPRPIVTITGEDEFAEVFLDDVRVPLSNVVGKIDGGWKVATALLEKERLNGANPQKCSYLLGKVKLAARQSGAIDDPAFRDRLVRAEIDYVALCATYAQIVKITETDMRSNADFAFAKLVAAELLQELCELMTLALGAEGALVEPVNLGEVELNPGVTYLQSRRATIYGGTVEIQRMLMARRVLGLV